MTDADAVMNDETRRALGRRVRQGGMLVVGAAVAIVLFGVAGLAAILSIPWQLSLALTAGVTVAIPAAVPYAMLRVVGLSHQDVLYVGKQAYREGVTEVVALSGMRETADVFTESIALGEETESSSSEAEEMDAEETSTESEPTDLQQQAEPEAQS
jgi:hypothetical protein